MYNKLIPRKHIDSITSITDKYTQLSFYNYSHLYSPTYSIPCYSDPSSSYSHCCSDSETHHYYYPRHW